MLATLPNIHDLLTRVQILEEKIKYAEKQYRAAQVEGKEDYIIKRLKFRLSNLRKEKCLYHAPMQKLKPLVGIQSYLHYKIESFEKFNSSRFE